VDLPWLNLYRHKEQVLRLLNSEDAKPLLQYILDRRQQSIVGIIYPNPDETENKTWYRRGVINGLDLVVELQSLLARDLTAPVAVEGYGA
jgi:hypothetical protein